MFQTVAMECACCRRLIFDENNDPVVTKLFGAAKYAVCPICYQEVGEELMKDVNYRARWRRRVAKIQMELNQRDE